MKRAKDPTKELRQVEVLTDCSKNRAAMVYKEF